MVMLLPFANKSTIVIVHINMTCSWADVVWKLTSYFYLCRHRFPRARKVPGTANVPASVCFLDPRYHKVPTANYLELVSRGEVEELSVFDPANHWCWMTFRGRAANDQVVSNCSNCGDWTQLELTLDVCKYFRITMDS